MESKQDRWDLSYLYKDFDDEAFKADLATLKEDAEKGIALFRDAAPGPVELLEQIVSYSEKLSEKADRLSNFIYCTLAVDATNEKANAAQDQLALAYTALQLAESAAAR